MAQQAEQSESPQSLSVAPTETKRDIALKQWQDQKNYYSRKVGSFKNRHLGLQLYIGIIAITVPILLGIPEISKYIPTILSGSIAIAAVIDNVNRYGENWRMFRTTLETLK